MNKNIEEDKLLDRIKSGTLALKQQLTDEQLTKLLDFIKILIKWNKAYNLTAITDPEEIVTHHVLDSLSIAAYIHADKILDVGSGAGLPGIPLAILFPEKKFVLLDSNGKKTRFITQACLELDINNVTVIHDRVEHFQATDCFKIITARAFSSVEKFLTLTQHLLCQDGELLMMKGVYPTNELQKIAKHATVYPLFVPGLNEQRHLILIKRASHG